MLLPNETEFVIEIERRKVVRFGFEYDFFARIGDQFLYRQAYQLRGCIRVSQDPDVSLRRGGEKTNRLLILAILLEWRASQDSHDPVSRDELLACRR